MKRRDVQLTSVRPYLIRALLDWIEDNGHTPYLVVDCELPGVDVPSEHATDGKLVLNVSANATRNLDVGNAEVHVDCRFRGRPIHIGVPTYSVVAVYGRESGMGMTFESETSDKEPPPSPPPAKVPKLKLVK